MKVLVRSSILFMIGVVSIYADENITKENVPALTLNNLGELGSILEPHVQALAIQIESFGTNLTILMSVFIALISIVGYLGFLRPYLNNNVRIEKAISQIDQKIEKEVKNQIIYTTDGELDKAKKYARKKIDYEIKEVKKEAYEKLFAYQELVYEVNQTIQTESDEILAQEDSSYEDKLKKIISLQYIYNEITNHDLPKLFSDDIHVIVSVSKQLSEHINIKSLIAMYLSGLLKLDKWSLEEKEEIKKVLKDYYKYKY